MATITDRLDQSQILERIWNSGKEDQPYTDRDWYRSFEIDKFRMMEMRGPQELIEILRREGFSPEFPLRRQENWETNSINFIQRIWKTLES